MNERIIKEVKERLGIIGNSPLLLQAIDVALQVAPTDLSVLITGQSGAGKEHFPKIIHQYSARKHKNYIAVNCGAIPEGTIDSELFGHEKGAFTGAVGERNGYFAEADGGTLFLDEVAELPLSTQARLLRVLESGEYIRVGSSTVMKTDVRIVAATNVNLTDAVAQGRFRQDLYYRLSTIPIRVPSLSERPGDIVPLFRKFAFEMADRYKLPTITLTESAKALIQAYPWPGNIRQLKNVTEQISLLSQEREITPEILKPYLQPVQQTLPMLFGQTEETKAGNFMNERELLYQVLFEMRRDITELRAQVSDIAQTRTAANSMNAMPAVMPADTISSTPTIDITHPTASTAWTPVASHTSLQHATAIDDTLVETVDETLTIRDGERELIRKALKRNKGRRKAAAAELKISERTLYRKIKLYGLDEE